eukprot:767267-Hanusia_phi.AAC.3
MDSECYRMQIVNKDGTRRNVVAKISKDPDEDKNTYYRDVQAQMCAKMWSMEFNECDVPKSIEPAPSRRTNSRGGEVATLLRRDTTARAEG